jgi:hypothetical protein
VPLVPSPADTTPAAPPPGAAGFFVRARRLAFREPAAERRLMTGTSKKTHVLNSRIRKFCDCDGRLTETRSTQQASRFGWGFPDDQIPKVDRNCCCGCWRFRKRCSHRASSGRSVGSWRTGGRKIRRRGESRLLARPWWLGLVGSWRSFRRHRWWRADRFRGSRTSCRSGRYRSLRAGLPRVQLPHGNLHRSARERAGLPVSSLS